MGWGMPQPTRFRSRWPPGSLVRWSLPTKELIPTTEDRLPLAELLAKSGDGDFLRTIAESVLQIIMEADVEGLVGAARHERSSECTTWDCQEFRVWAGS